MPRQSNGAPGDPATLQFGNIIGQVARLAVVAGLALLASSAAPATPTSRTISIAGASDLRFALDAVIAGFRAQHPDIEVKPTYGSSGSFYAQILAKAPFDIFLSADVELPRRLAEQGLAAKGSEFLYALGQIVVWVPNASKLDLARLGMRALVAPGVRKVAIANPAHAPYGRAAEAAMKTLGVADAVRPRLVLGENVSQAAQYIATGAADVGIIALSLATSPALKDKGRYWLVPATAYPRIEQGGIVLGAARDPAAAATFRAYFLSDVGKRILQRFGFQQSGA